jgi:REP element-mobilizing transposase RayT
LKQLKLSKTMFFKTPITFGGELNLKKRKSIRPLDSKKPLHLVLKADSNKPVFLHQDRIVNKLIRQFADLFGIKIYESSVNANHIHLVIGFKHRKQYQYFVSSLSGQMAQLFNLRWLYRPFTRIIEWGRDLKNVCAYIIQNQKEAWGLISYKRRNSPSRAGPTLQH